MAKRSAKAGAEDERGEQRGEALATRLGERSSECSLPMAKRRAPYDEEAERGDEVGGARHHYRRNVEIIALQRLEPPGGVSIEIDADDNGLKGVDGDVGEAEEGGEQRQASRAPVSKKSEWKECTQ
jgi:hypothetical protein